MDPAGRPSKVRARLRMWAAALWSEHATPSRIGVAVGFGVWMGCTPIFGLQTLVALALATWFGLNRPAVLAGLQISIPPLAPLVLFADATVGALVLRGVWAPWTLATLRALPRAELVRTLLAELAVGGAVVGLALGVPLGLLATSLVRRARRAR